MKKLVLSGSAKNQVEVNRFLQHFKDKYEILDYPKVIDGDFIKNYNKVHTSFYKNIENADVFFLMNFDKNGVKGYVGSAGFGELCIALFLKLIAKKEIEILIYQMPDKSVASYDEIELWLKLGYIKIYDKRI